MLPLRCLYPNITLLDVNAKNTIMKTLQVFLLEIKRKKVKVGDCTKEITKYNLPLIRFEIYVEKSKNKK